MSNTIDERIVQMQFNNRQFESGVRESVSSLEKLKKGLQLDDATRSLSGLSSAGRNFNLGGIASGVDTIASRFTALGIIGVTALTNITNAALNTGKQIVSALTIDPIKTGFNEYELKMNAIQTMMAGSGESLETVNQKLADLNAYSDRTIYSFSDMTQNIGKFTNAGVKLDDAVAAIKGISNEAAISGANANEAARAMYNLSQAMSMGYVQLIDWKSIEMANMATVDFKNNLLETAVAAGTIKKTSKGMYVTPQGDELSAMGMFKEGLMSQWLTSKNLIDTLKKYSDETTDLGKKAFAAAQDIKTLTQMYGVLKESAQSGWAQTWEIVAGNFDEGKSLFTQLNEYIGGFISASAKARNEMLQFWKDKGGRDDLIKSFENLNTTATQIITPIKEAFREFFPAMTGERLVDFTKKFKDFTEKLKIGEDSIAKIKKIASGAFAGLSIGVEFIKSLSKNLIDFIKWLSPAGKGLTDFTANIADWLVSLDDSIKKGDLFNKAFDKVEQKVEDASEAVKTSFKKMIDAIEDFSGVDFTSFDTFVTTLKEKLAPLEKIGEFVDKSITWIGNLFKKMGPFFAKIGTGIGEFISKMNLTSIVQLFETGIMATIIAGISKLIKSLTTITDGAGGFLKGITEIFDGVRGCLSAWQQDLKAGILLKIAGAILVLAIALLVMSTIDVNKLSGALAAMTTLFVELFGSMAMFDKIVGSSGFKSMGKVTASMILLSVAVLLLAAAAKELGSLDWQGLSKGLVGVSSLVAMLIATSKLMAQASGDILKSSVGLIAFAVAIKLMASAVVELGSLDTETLIKGMISLLGVCAMLVGMMAASKLGGMGLKESLGLIAMALAIRILASAVGSFGKMKPEAMVQGIWALALVLSELAIFIYVVDGKQMAAVGAGLLILAASMVIFAFAVKKFGEMPFETLCKGLLGMAVALGAVVLAINFMPKNMVSIGIGMLAISLGLVMIAKAMQMVGSLSMEQIVKGIVGLGLALLMIVIAVNAVQGAIAGAAALVIVTIALLGLAVVMKMIGGMPIEAIGKALLAIALVLTILGAAAAILTPILPSMLILGAALLLLGVGLAAVGAATIILSIGLAALSVAGLAGVGILLAITAAMLPMVLMAPAILIVGAALLVLSIGVMAVGFALTILGAGLGMIVALGEPGMNALLALANTAVQIAQFALDLVAAGAGLVLFGAGAILAGVGALLAGAGLLVLALGLEALAKVDLTQVGGIMGLAEDLSAASLLLLLAAPGLLTAGAALIVFGEGATSTGEGIASITVGLLALTQTVMTVPGVIEAGTNVIREAFRQMIENLISFIESRKSSVVDTFEGIVDASAKAIENQRSLFYYCGTNAVEGFVMGIKSRIAAAADAAAGMARTALNAANAELDIHSPSGKFELAGKFGDLGFAKGFEKYAHIPAMAASTMAEKTITPVMTMTREIPSPISFGSRQVASASTLATEVQNRSVSQYQTSKDNVVNPASELTGVITVQIKNDKGEIIGIAQTAVKDLLRRESR